MGIDVYYNAMIEDCEFFRLAKADFNYYDFLTDLTTSYEAIYAPWIYSDEEPTSMDLKIIEARKALRKTNIGIENRNHFTRAWDIFLWLLSEQRRAGTYVDEITDIWGRAIIGGDYVYKGIDYTEPRFLNAQEVQIITEKLISVSEDDLRKFYTPDINGNVYKFRYYIENPDQSFKQILERFNWLRDFYKSVAENNEGVVTTRWG